MSTFDDTVMISDVSYAGDYYLIQNLQQGQTYVFSSTGVSDYITIRDEDGFDLIAHGPSPLSHTVSGEDILTIHIHLTSPPCGTEMIFRTTKVVCTSCPDVPGMTGINTSSPEATLEVAGELRIGNSGLSPKTGMIRWNPTTEDFEGYNGEKWMSFTKATTGWGVIKPNEAQEHQIQQKIVPSNSDFYGTAVAISGNYAVVGAPGEIVAGEIRGAAYVYKRINGTWHEQVQLIASDGALDDLFGISVAIDGNDIVVGAMLDDIGSNIDQGSAYVFHREGEIWVEQAKLKASDGGPDENFGNAVDIDNGYILVGARFDQIDLDNAQGSAYVFMRSGNSWLQQDKLTASDGNALDLYGFSVSLSGTLAVIGAPFKENVSLQPQGAAYIFLRNGASWTEQQKIEASDIQPDDQFGFSVSIDGTTLLAGSNFHQVNGNAGQGAAYVYTYDGALWTNEKKLTSNGGSDSDHFATDLEIHGNYALIGAYDHTVNGNEFQGAAYVYEKISGQWKQLTKLLSSDGQVGDGFGSAVGISTDQIIVGMGIPGSSQIGKVYFFHQ